MALCLQGCGWGLCGRRFVCGASADSFLFLLPVSVGSVDCFPHPASRVGGVAVVSGYDVDVDVRDGLAGGFPVVHPYGEGVASVGAAYSPLLCAHFVSERHPFVLVEVTEMLDVPSGDDEGVPRVDRVVVFGGDRQGPRPHDDTSFQPVRQNGQSG